jgi:DNA phosphorothioation-associated putative methyltransferase
MEIAVPIIQRHKTAIRRPSLSLPVKCLLRDGLLDASKRFFDYGCGHGRDIALLQNMGVGCDGWDPAHRPQVRREAAEVVNLGYVINVIEDPRERAQALRGAWELATGVLAVAAQVVLATGDREYAPFGDGVVTSRGTFQKYYRQHELRGYLEEQLGADALPAAPGIFYLFKDETAKQEFLASRYRRAVAVPRRRISELLFEQNQDVLEPFMECLTRLGRLPGPEGCPQIPELVERFGSVKRAFGLIRRVTDAAPWVAIAERRKEDLLVYLALARFRRRPAFSHLPRATQYDARSFFGTYAEACREADRILFHAGDAAAIGAACQRSSVGLLVENALLVHRSALDHLEPLLRIYEGCARALVGEVDGTNVIKLHRFSGKVSYLAYPDFEKDPHPALSLRVKVSLRTLWIEYFDYDGWEDPFILCRKDALLGPDHALRRRFEKLKRQEEAKGLLRDPSSVASRGRLERQLQLAGLTLCGHRLCAESRLSADRA